jgi:hypothetical protein
MAAKYGAGEPGTIPAPASMTKKDKSEVQYTPIAHMKSERCDRCKHFRPLYEKCDLVKGHINPGAWCDLWEKK